MGRFFKWLLAGLAAIFAGIVLVAGISAILVYRTLPQNHSEFALNNLKGPVEVSFDENGVPHIFGGSVSDTMQAFGFIHARDRLWQMEFLRRVGEGRLSEILGEPTVETDVFLRTLDMATAARRSYERLLPETKIALEAYAQGVNAYINRPTKMLEPAVGAEFMILGHTAEPWEPWNSVLILKVMGLTLGHNMDREIQRLALAANGHSPKEIEEIVSYSPRDTPPPLPDLRSLLGLSQNKSSDLQQKFPSCDHAKFSLMDLPTGSSASNNWVISGSRTDTGKPILANDPHLGLTAPSAFYLAHLSWTSNGKRSDVVGGTLPGVPFVIAGRNKKVAWGLTTTNLDSQDIFIEEINPDDPKQYRTETGWNFFEEQAIEIGVSGKEAVRMIRRVSRNGPILPEGFRKLSSHLPADRVAALRWSGLDEDDTSIDTLYLNGIAKNVDDLINGMKRAVSPMQSVVMADVDGNIALATPARVPLRSPENDMMGRAPVPGWLPEYQWQRSIDSSEVPVFRNDEKGAYATANAKFFPDDYPLHISYDWAEHFRQERVEKLVFENSALHDFARSRKIMSDDFSSPLRKLVQLSARQARTGASKTGTVLQALARWDGRMQANRAEPLIALALFRHLHENILADDFGDDYELFARGRITRLIGILERGTLRNWCDDVTTVKTESCGEIIALSLNEAMDELEDMQGPDWRSWEYGKAHVAYSEHRPFGAVKALAQYFDIKVPSGGGPYTLHRGQTNFSKDNPYFSRHGGAYRAIYDLSNLDRSLFMISSGQSGNFLSNHYDDLAKKWSKSDFITIPTSRSAIEKRQAGKWVFRPL